MATATELDGIEKALNDDATKASTLWIAFITFELYLSLTIGSVTHRDIFLENPLKLPVLGTDLPLVAFFKVAPAVFVLFHFFVLIQLLILSNTIRTYQEILQRTYPIEADKNETRSRLNSFFYVQSVIGPRANRLGMTGISLRLIAWLTLVVAPIILLFQSLVTLLPLHDSGSTWTTRSLILVDTALIIILWCGPVNRSSNWFIRSLRIALRAVVAALGFAFVASMCVGVATYPNDELIGLLPRYNQLDALHAFLFDGPIDEIAGRPTSYFSNRLVLWNQSFLPADKTAPSLVFRGRELRGAVFSHSNLKGADFTGAMLNNAIFKEATLDDAKFGCANRRASLLKNPSANTPEHQPWPDDGCTWLIEADFSEASVQRIAFSGSHADGAIFSRAKLRGSSFESAYLNGADFSFADLPGTKFYDTHAVGADFFASDLRAVKLDLADFQFANFGSAKLHAMSVGRSQFDGGSFDRAEMQGTEMDETTLHNASFGGAYVWGISWASPSSAPGADETDFDKMNETSPPWTIFSAVEHDTYEKWKKRTLDLVTHDSKDEIEGIIDGLKPSRRPSKRQSLKSQATGRYSAEDRAALGIQIICDNSEHNDSKPNTYVVKGITRTLRGSENFKDALAARRKDGNCALLNSFSDSDWNELMESAK